VGHRGAADSLQEILQGLVHRPALHGGARQAIEVAQHLRAICVQLIIQLSPATQLAQEQAQPPPDQEPLGVDHQRGEAGIVDLVDPGIELGEEVAHGPHQDRTDPQRRPRLSRRCATWPRIKARVNWLTSWIRALSRWYSCTHVRTSSRRSWGTY